MLQEEELMKSGIRIQENYIRRNDWLNTQIQLEQHKSILREEERERIKSQVEIVSMNADGVLCVQTKNLRIKDTERRVCNFSNPEIVFLHHMENAKEFLYLFLCDINGKDCYTILQPEKCQSGAYLLNKFSQMGGRIYANSLALQKNYLKQIVALFISKKENSMTLPNHRGWIKESNDKFTFFDGKLTWEEALKCAK